MQSDWVQSKHTTVARRNVDSTMLDFMLHKAELLRKVNRKMEAAQLERAARRARAGLNSEDASRWVVDYHELQKLK